MNPEVTRISINQDERIVGFLNRMLDLKKETNQEVEGELENGKFVTTEGCNTLEEALVANNQVIFKKFEEERNNILNSSEMENAIEKFQNRGLSENSSEKEKNEVEEQFPKFQSKLQELATLDFSKSIQVYNWLVDVIDYVNNSNLNVLIGESEEERVEISTFITNYLNKKGYTSELNEVNTMDDYFRRLIAYQIEELSNYKFFAYEYVLDLQEQKNLQVDEAEETKETTLEDQLVDLINEQKKLQRSMTVLEMCQKGELDKSFQKTVSYATRKEEIQKEIENIKSQITEVPTEKLEDAKKRIERLNSFIVDEKIKNNAAMPFYNKALQTRESEDILKALEAVEQLDDSHMYKRPLQEVLNTLNDTYYTQQIADLETKYKKVEQEEQEMQDFITPIQSTTNQDLENINSQIEKIQQEIAQSANKDKEPETNTPEETVKDDYLEKLKAIAAEGPIMREHEEDLSLIKDDKKQITQIIKDTFTSFKDKLSKNNVSPELQNINFYDLMDELAEEEKRENEKPETKQEEENSFGYNLTPTPLKKQLREEIKQKITNFYSKFNKENTESVKEFKGDDFYNLLKEIAAEGAIMKEHEEDLNIDQEANKPHIIKTIKKAPAVLKNKVRNSEFVKKIKETLKFIYENRVKFGLGGVVVTLAITGAITLLSPKSGKEVKADNIVLEETMDNEENTITNNIEQEVAIDTAVEEKTDEQQLNEALQEALNDIVNGENVYSNVYDAASGTNSLKTNQSQRDNSWANAEADTFYNSNSEVISREEAEKIIAEGGQVVASFDNEGTIIGYTKVGQEITSDASGKSM